MLDRKTRREGSDNKKSNPLEKVATLDETLRKADAPGPVRTLMTMLANRHLTRFSERPGEERKLVGSHYLGPHVALFLGKHSAPSAEAEAATAGAGAGL